MERMESQGELFLWALGGVALGALAMYLMDPDRGRRRRALIRDQFTHVASRTRRELDSRSRDMANRARGMMAEAEGTVRHWKEEAQDRMHQREAR